VRNEPKFLEPGGAARNARRRLSFENRIYVLALAAGLPGIGVASWLLWQAQFEPATKWTLGAMLVVLWFGCVQTLRHRVRYPLQTLSNILAGFREGDFSMRLRGAKAGDALGEVLAEVNTLGSTLREQRLGALEATALLRTVMEEIDVAIFTFDQEQRLRLVNRAGERLMARNANQLLGRTAAELGLGECLTGEAVRTMQVAFPGGLGRWGLRRTSFRQEGAPHQLIVLTDLSRALREEERQAWQRLVRVLGHELNNSLAPIKSIAGSLGNLLSCEPRPADWQQDMQRGLEVILGRAESLERFMAGYAQLTRLPPPRKRDVRLSDWVRRIAALETKAQLTMEPGPDITIQGDSDQLDQLLINLVRNAAEATLETGGKVRIAWQRVTSFAEVRVEDDGPGLSNTTNLFVPFFTTKPKGTGIGLVLSRQIAEAHGGSLNLENKTTGRGCVARLRLPIA
jgi:two-component system, NtrC family, nitrogen regulation sensor histidine kinase NtrY